MSQSRNRATYSELYNDVFDVLNSQDVGPAKKLIYELYSKRFFSKLSIDELIDVLPRLKALYAKKD